MCSSRSFTDFKVLRQYWHVFTKNWFSTFERCFARYDLLKDAYSVNVFSLFSEHTVHTFLLNSHTEPIILWNIKQVSVQSFLSAMKWLHDDLDFCRIVLILEMICSEMLFHVILAFCCVGPRFTPFDFYQQFLINTQFTYHQVPLQMHNSSMRAVPFF